MTSINLIPLIVTGSCGASHCLDLLFGRFSVLVSSQRVKGTFEIDSLLAGARKRWFVQFRGKNYTCA